MIVSEKRLAAMLARDERGKPVHYFDLKGRGEIWRLWLN